MLSNDAPVPTSDAGYLQAQQSNANVIGGLVTNKPLVLQSLA